MNSCYFRCCRLLVKATVSAVMSLVCLATAAVFTRVLMYLHFWQINDDDDAAGREQPLGWYFCRHFVRWPFVRIHLIMLQAAAV